MNIKSVTYITVILAIAIVNATGKIAPGLLATCVVNTLAAAAILLVAHLYAKSMKGKTLLVSDLKQNEEVNILELWEVRPHYRAIIDRQEGKEGSECRWLTIRESECEGEGGRSLKRGVSYRARRGILVPPGRVLN